MDPNRQLPVFARGLGRVRLALQPSLGLHRRRPSLARLNLPWHDGLLTQGGPSVAESRTLADLGYAHSPHPNIPVQTITGLSKVGDLFNAEGVAALVSECEQLEYFADNSAWIISRRTRGVTGLSPLIDAMMKSRAFLFAISRIAGVPLVPYPMENARSQVNYFYPKVAQQGEQLGMWHTDGTNYVLNIVLSDDTQYSGGTFLYHDGTIDTFDRKAVNHLQVRSASLAVSGDALFIYGSRLFHGVTPVRTGRRMSLVLSFHCPYTREDSNRFWHLASDDGIAATLPNWRHLRRSLAKPAAQQFIDLGIDPISFDELRGS